jgi:hypothetical protein
MLSQRLKAATLQGLSTEAHVVCGLSRSSYEVAVMARVRKGRLVKVKCIEQLINYQDETGTG